MMYMVTAIRDGYDGDYGVEVAGIFDTDKKAFKAKERVEKWMKENGYEHSVVFIARMDVNRIEWYDVEEDI